jgi:hypothetical protein
VEAFAHIVALTAPLFLLILVGYSLARFGGWPPAASDALTRFVFSVAVPALLFRLMSDFSSLPPVDARLLFAYFGGCVLVFAGARIVAARAFGLGGVDQSIFGLGAIFSNNVLLGVPLAQVTLGAPAMPTVSLIVVFNALLLWTLVTVSVEWARHGEVSVAALAKTARQVALNPVIAGILIGTAWGFTGLALPRFADDTLSLVAQAAVPLSLIALGMGLAEYGMRAEWRQSATITLLKLTLQPAIVYALARALDLPWRETQAVTVMAALPVGANVYLMSREFDAMGGPVAASLVLSTALAAATVPVVLALLGGPPR